ncbi:RAI1-domain-containing protein [Lentinula detonsa]|uniref:Decapping nuclease n=1 Tax=Lentinula detonsa TaxID=2804962 RepID=A0A9W8NQZ4_9AGAR|nr:RAI1-domain-containing protein [Lentinula detonsa]
MSKRKISSAQELTEGTPSKSKRRLDAYSDSPTTSPVPITKQTMLAQIGFLPYSSVTPQTFLSKSIPFQQPMPLTSFSYTADHIQQFNDSALRYFRPPPPNAHLGYGYERWIRRPEERSRIDSLLRAVDRITDGQRKKMNLEDVGVVAWRGVITRILTAPYEDREGWEMNVMLIKGTLYLEEHRSESLITEKNNIKPHHRKRMYYGYAFESYCTADTDVPSSSKTASTRSNGPSHVARVGDTMGWGGDVNTNIQWCSIVRTKLGDTRFVIGGEVDCSDGQYKGTTDTFVELKTSMSIRGAADEEKFERKLLKFYFQSFLLGVPKIVVGFRTPSGQLTSTQSFQTMQIPRMVREKAENKRISTPWNPSLCLAWCHHFLAYLKRTLAACESDDIPNHQNPAEDPEEKVQHDYSPIPTQVWRVSFLPGEGARLVKLDRSDVEEVVNGEDRVGFIPRWYWDKIKSSSAYASHSDFIRSTTTEQPVQGAVGGWQI